MVGRRSDNFFEEHIEKLVLVAFGLVCFWLLISRVLVSPNYIVYGNKKFGTGDIDNYISKQAELLEDKSNRKSEPKPPYERRLGSFAALVDSALSGLDVSLSLPYPNNSSAGVGIKPIYALPLIGEVNDVEVEHIRAVAYVPTEEIDEENTYEEVEHRPNDIDLVTVEAKFDVAGLYKRFYESFAGEDVNEDWRDPCLAEPVFAAIQLERQQMAADGSWSDWQIVPRTKIDYRREMFDVVEEFDELPPGGMKVRLLQFNSPEVRSDLLQPESYQIASAEEEWFPPSLHKEFVKHQASERVRERFEAKAAEKEERKREREGLRAEREKLRAKRGSKRQKTEVYSGEDLMSGFDMMMGAAPSAGRTQPPPRKIRDRRSEKERSVRARERETEKERGRKRREPSKTINDFYDEFEDILITEESDPAKMSEPLIFWAHDDTVEPERSYRYRIRLGVFNPIAGTSQLRKQDKWQKNKAILWSGYSVPTKTVETPGNLYFFASGIQEAARIVTVRVSRYALGYWYSEDFVVRQGEDIGKVVETEPLKKKEDAESGLGGKEEEITMPEEIDYSTGAVLVDVVPVKDWSGMKKLKTRRYHEMLYSFDGDGIKHMPIKARYWAKETHLKFSEIEKSEREPKKPLRPWASRAGHRRLGPTTPIDEFQLMEEEMMMMMGGAP